MADWKEVLKGLGVEDNLLDAISSKIPADKKLHVLEDGQFVPMTRFNEVNEQKNTYKKQTDDLTSQVAQLGQFKGTADELQKKLQEVQTSYEAKLVEQEKTFNQKRLNNELDTVITLNKGRNSKAIKALFNMEAIKLDGDNVVGVSDQLEAIKKDNPYLFDLEQQPTPPNRVGNTNNPPNSTISPQEEALRKAFGLKPKE